MEYKGDLESEESGENLFLILKEFYYLYNIRIYNMIIIIYANKDLSSQSYGFSSSHVWM